MVYKVIDTHNEKPADASSSNGFGTQSGLFIDRKITAPADPVVCYIAEEDPLVYISLFEKIAVWYE